MYGTVSFQGAPMDTDIKVGAWFDLPSTSNFPAFGRRETVPTFAVPNIFSTLGNSKKVRRNPFESTNNPFSKDMTQTRGSSRARFRSTYVSDTAIRNGVTTPVDGRHQILTTMPEYEHLSLEEIRLEDYCPSFTAHETGKNSNCRVPEPSCTSTKQVPEPSFAKPAEVPAPPPLLNVILRNVANPMSAKNCATGSVNNDASPKSCSDTTLDLMQALMDHVKQRFDVNCLSNEAKRSCEELTSALVDFTEKTLENITVVVLEDMLNNIKQRTANVPKNPNTSDKSTNTCPCSAKNTPQKENADHSPTTSTSKKSPPGCRDDEKCAVCSSEGENSTEEGTSAYKEPEHSCELAISAEKGDGRKKATSLPASLNKSASRATRSSRYSCGGAGRSAERLSKYRVHRRLSDEKYSYRERTADDSDIEGYVRCHESKYGHRDDGWVTITKARHHRDSNRRRRKSRKKLHYVIKDECFLCDGLERVAIQDFGRKEYLAVERKDRADEKEVQLVDRVVGAEHQRADTGASGSSTNTSDSAVAQKLFEEVRSYSDSSSV